MPAQLYRAYAHTAERESEIGVNIIFFRHHELNLWLQ